MTIKIDCVQKTSIACRPTTRRVNLESLSLLVLEMVLIVKRSISLLHEHGPISLFFRSYNLKKNVIDVD